MLKYIHDMEGKRRRFWKKCIQIARAHPELSAEEVEHKAVLTELGFMG